jgi:hypothetical protein
MPSLHKTQDIGQAYPHSAPVQAYHPIRAVFERTSDDKHRHFCGEDLMSLTAFRFIHLSKLCEVITQSRKGVSWIVWVSR